MKTGNRMNKQVIKEIHDEFADSICFCPLDHVG